MNNHPSIRVMLELRPCPLCTHKGLELTPRDPAVAIIVCGIKRFPVIGAWGLPALLETIRGELGLRDEPIVVRVCCVKKADFKHAELTGRFRYRGVRNRLNVDCVQHQSRLAPALALGYPPCVHVLLKLFARDSPVAIRIGRVECLPVVRVWTAALPFVAVRRELTLGDEAVVVGVGSCEEAML